MIAVTALWLGLLGAGYASGRLYGRYRLRRAGDSDGRSRGTYRLLAVVGLTTFVVLGFAGLIDATESALSSVHPALGGGLAAPLVWLPSAVGTIVAVLVTYLGVFPYARERRDLEIDAATAIGRLARYLAAISLFVLGVVGLYTALLEVSNPNPALIPVVFLVLTTGIYGWMTFRIRLSQDVEPLTAEQRRRLEAAADRADLTATVAGAIPGRETEVAVVYLDGPFWNRRAYATDYAFDAFDDDELWAACARASAADEGRLLERQALVTSALLGLLVTCYVWRSFALALLAVAIGWPLAVRYLQRCEFAADRRAARAVGADALESTLETGADLSDDRGRLQERLASTPSRSRRLERLRDA
ncbi:peptidase [Natrinema sp. 1APR25-10V2]|uniref:peptidase n=1 Tax=Natrinema sp. 1APR25-10V2 TaxID=2951081 RepID=UPI0028767E04|nr:peptidase [Natrinema sp. 1APR25-10V2]MDS0476542.1 peptidase [Natrinema sp. 1APR25-10V2]